MKKTYLEPCPECGRNNRVVMVRGTLRREFSCACYKCEHFGPIARTRRGAVRKWNRYAFETEFSNSTEHWGLDSMLEKLKSIITKKEPVC